MTYRQWPRTYCAIGGNLCSRTTPAEAGDRRCVGGFDCVFDSWPRMPASHVRADVVFIDSCSTAGFRSRGPQADQGLSIATHLLDGHASAVITASRTLCNDPVTPYLLWHLLASGERLGDAVRVISQLLQSRLGLLHPYLLLGDPEQRACNTFESCPTVAPEGHDDGLWTFSLDVQPGRVQRYRVDDDSLARAALTQRRVACLVGPALAERSRLELVPSSDGGIDLVAAWDEACPPGPTKLLITTSPPVDESVRSVAERVRLATRIDAGWLDEEGVSARERLEALIGQHESELLVADCHTLNDGRRYAHLDGVGRRLLSASHEVCRAMLGRLLERSGSSVLWLYDHYQRRAGVRFDGETATPTPCHYCGAEVHAQRLVIGLWPPRARRLFECEACAVLGDAPDRHELLLMLRVPDRVTKGETFTVEIEGCTDGPAIVHLAPSFSRLGHPAEAFEFEPKQRELIHDRAGPFHASFECRLSTRLPTHMFHIQALAVIDGEIHWSIRKVHVIDSEPG